MSEVSIDYRTDDIFNTLNAETRFENPAVFFKPGVKKLITNVRHHFSHQYFVLEIRNFKLKCDYVNM